MRESYQPKGRLGQVLEEFQAPENVKSSIARRAGLVVARGQLPIEKLQNTITESMFINSGLPDWNIVSVKVGETVNDIYRKSRRSW
jgi:hypothetical protein